MKSKSKPKTSQKKKNIPINPIANQSKLIDIAILNGIYNYMLIMNNRFTKEKKTLLEVYNDPDSDIIMRLNSSIRKLELDNILQDESESMKIFTNQFIKDVEDFTTFLIFKKTDEYGEDILEYLKKLRHVYRNSETKLKFLAYKLAMRTDSTTDILLVIIRLLLLDSRLVSYTGSRYKDYKETYIHLEIQPAFVSKKSSMSIYKLFLCQYILEYYFGVDIFLKRIRIKDKNLEVFMHSEGIYPNEELLKKVRVLDNSFTDEYDLSFHLTHLMAVEMKSIYFNDYMVNNISLNDNEYIRLRIPADGFRSRSKIIPEEGIIFTVEADNNKVFRAECKEYHDNGHFFVINYSVILDNGNYYNDILSVNMEDCDVMMSVNVALSISTFFRNIGIEDEILFNSFSMPYDDTHVFSGTYEDYCKDSLYGEFIPIREEIRKENNINYYFEIPKSWNFTNKNPEVTHIDHRKLSRKRDTVHFIDVHTRKIKGKASDTAEEIAKKYFLKVGKGITVVKPHLRTY